MIDIKDNKNRIYKNLSNLKLKITELTTIRPIIDNTCNTLNIIISNETKKIELDDGEYSLDDLVEGITENLTDVNIKCKKDKKGRVIFENTNSNDFEIDCENNSFGKFLGFMEQKYEGSSKYISETSSALLLDSIYLYFVNISAEKPFCKINLDKSIEYLYNPKDIVAELDCLIIQIKDSKTIEEVDFHNFNEQLFEFELEFECDKE